MTGGGAAHDHGGDAAPEAHGVASAAGNARRIAFAAVLTGSFMIVEVVGGVLSGSLALLSDAGHMLTDFASLTLAWLAYRVARRPSDPRRTYGYHRARVLAALINGLSLLAVVLWIGVEAVDRLLAPAPIAGWPMLAVAVAGLFVNIVAFAILHRGNRHDVNLRGAALHVIGDLMGSVGAIAAAIVILVAGWTPIDPILSLLIAALIVRSAYRLLSDTVHILLEGAPRGAAPDDIRRALSEAVPAVRDVHHVHIWSLTDETRMLTAHVTADADADSDHVLLAVRRALAARFGIAHATIQVERGQCPDDLLEADAKSRDGATDE